MVLPGGMPGTLHLGEHEGVKQVLEQFCREKKYIAAICAAPSVLGKYGMLKGRKATSYPGFEDALLGAEYVYDKVVADEYFITSRGMGTAIAFALKLIELLVGEEQAKKIGESIIYE